MLIQCNDCGIWLHDDCLVDNMYSYLNIFNRNNRARDLFTVKLMVDDAASKAKKYERDSCPRFQIEDLEKMEIFEKQAECLNCARLQGDTTQCSFRRRGWNESLSASSALFLRFPLQELDGSAVPTKDESEKDLGQSTPVVKSLSHQIQYYYNKFKSIKKRWLHFKPILAGPSLCISESFLKEAFTFM